MLTTEWTPADNDGYRQIIVPDIEADALVDYRIEVDGPGSRMHCIVVGAYYFAPIADIVKSTRFELNGRVRLRKDHSIALFCYSMLETIPAIVRVYILAWEVNHDLLLDYTDLDGHSRVVLAPPKSAPPVRDNSPSDCNQNR